MPIHGASTVEGRRYTNARSACAPRRSGCLGEAARYWPDRSRRGHLVHLIASGSSRRHRAV